MHTYGREVRAVLIRLISVEKWAFSVWTGSLCITLLLRCISHILFDTIRSSTKSKYLHVATILTLTQLLANLIIETSCLVGAR